MDNKERHFILFNSALSGILAMGQSNVHEIDLDVTYAQDMADRALLLFKARWESYDDALEESCRKNEREAEPFTASYKNR